MKWLSNYFFLIIVAIAPLHGMQKTSGDVTIAMNSSASEHISRTDCYTLSTNGLQGCVATILDLEYADGDHAIFLGHFAFFAKTENLISIQNFLRTSAHAKTIKKATCILIPPGINQELIRTRTRIAPIFDVEWKEMIITLIKNQIPNATISIAPYLFNAYKSSVHYSYARGKTKLEIKNGSPIMDSENKNLLLETHNYEPEEIQCHNVLVPAIAAMALAGIYWYFTN